MKPTRMTSSPWAKAERTLAGSVSAATAPPAAAPAVLMKLRRVMPLLLIVL
jgi:hypothetical protein